MNKVERLEDYTNAVIAIVITLMVLDIHAPTGHFFSDILRANDHFLTYIYSFFIDFNVLGQPWQIIFRP